jgi:hypothetical protein
MKKIHQLALLLPLLVCSSCDGETVFKGLLWGMQQIAGEGYLPSQELMDLGGFEGVEVQMSQAYGEDAQESFIELRLINGRSRQLLLDEENTARRCAELYVTEYSKSKAYDSIKISLIFQDPLQPENYSIREYIFPTSDLLE